ncbi:hypothetical protein ACP4OV_009117 [Aristida adscensionis]
MTRLPDSEVQSVLAWKRQDMSSQLAQFLPPEYIESHKILKDHFEEFQAWMRAEYEKNGGYVEVDDEMIAQREEKRWFMQELWDELTALDDIDLSKIEGLTFGYDGYNNDEDSEEDEEFC